MSEIGSEGHLRGLGFAGFVAMNEVNLADIPLLPGVYAVLRGGEPQVEGRSVGGWFKGKDPSVDVDILTARLNQDADVLYFGKAGQSSSRRGLRKRISELLQFGSGMPVGHWGGRYLWQLSSPFSNLLAWLPLDASEVDSFETVLLTDFRDTHGALPFANLRM